MNNKLAKVAIGILAVFTLITGGVLAAFAAPAQSAKGISITFKEKTLSPFGIIKIKGKKIDSAAATSVIFTTAGGQVSTVPALSVSGTAVEVSVPPVAYNSNTNTFDGANASFKVIQIKNTKGKFTVKTSNEITGVSISPASRPAGYENLPKGALSVSFLVAAKESLKAIESKLPTENNELQNAFIASGFEIDQLQAAISGFVTNPSAPMEISTENGTVTITADDIAKLDAIYAGFLSQLENRHLVSSEPDSRWSFIPVAKATEMNECMKKALGEGIGDTQLQNILAEPCNHRESAATQAGKLGKVLPEAAKFTYTFPFTVTNVMLGAAGLSKAAQIALSAGYSFMTETFLEGKAKTSNASVSIAKAIVDHKLGVPAMEIGVPAAKLFYEVSEAFSKKKAPGAVLSVPNTMPAAVQFVKAEPNGTLTTSGTLAIPAAAQSTATKEPSKPNKPDDQTPVTPVVTPTTPEPTPEPTTPEPESEKVYSVTITLTATEHTQCDQNCVGHIDDATATTTITFDNFTISPGYVGSESKTVSAPFTFSCQTTASGGKTGSFSDSLDGYTSTISIVDTPTKGISFRYGGEPNYKYFQDTCAGYTSDPQNLIKKALQKAMWEKDELAKRVYNINGETVSFSGRDHDAAISNDLSSFDYSGTLIITKVR